MTLTLFSRSQEGLDCWKIGRSLLSALYLLIEWTDFSQIYTNISLGEGKMLIRFLVTLTPFSRSQEGLDCWKMGRSLLSALSQEGLDCWKIGRSLLSALYLLIEWTNFSQTYTNISLGGGKCWLDFGDHDPIFKVTGGLRLLENGLFASYLLKEWIDFDQTHIFIAGTCKRTD